ncbi:MAG: MBL fold metallo-hydrolase [Anaerolineales bacterium]|nr:MBL fold metallo-hydrolase [Anaerolineales bacterium]
MTSAPVRFRVGEFACVSLPDTIETLLEEHLQLMFPTDTDRWLAAFRALPGSLTFCRNILLVEARAQRLLIDTGNGSADPNDPGHLLEQLRAANLPPESITTLVITHYHPDHLGGLVDESGRPSFPNARLVVPSQEHAHWTQPDVLAGLDPADAAAFHRMVAAHADRLTPLDDTAAIAPGIHYLSAVGHSPGHRAVLLESGGARLLHLADAIHTPLQLNALDQAPFDWQHPAAAAATRRALVSQAAAEGLLVMAYHFPFPGVGYFRRHGDQLAWEPYTASAP